MTVRKYLTVYCVVEIYRGEIILSHGPYSYAEALIQRDGLKRAHLDTNYQVVPLVC